jgi:uncharacterized protein YggE
MMNVMTKVPVLAMAATLAAFPQGTPRVRSVRAFGEAVVSIRPDLARVNVSVITQGATAEAAAAENATVAAAVTQALTSKFRGAEIRTVAYHLSPNYRTPAPGQPATISGYTATNSIQITTGDLASVGPIIDAAIAAGASRIDALQHTIKDEEPVRNQALRLAGQKARARAEAIAAGLGVRLGQVLQADEGVTYRPLAIDARAAAAAPTTPIEPGTLQVSATITLEMEIVQ